MGKTSVLELNSMQNALNSYHENTKGRKHEIEKKESFAFSLFRAFVIEFGCGSATGEDAHEH